MENIQSRQSDLIENDYKLFTNPCMSEERNVLKLCSATTTI